MMSSQGRAYRSDMCTDHYLQMNRQLHQPNPCASCEEMPKKGEPFTRHCPAPKTINNYLNHISSEAANLTDTSIICYSCYKYFHWILNQIQENTKPQQVPTSSDDTDTVISTLSKKIQTIELKGPKSISVSDYRDIVLCQIGIEVALAFSKDEVLLLPNVYRDFASKFQDPSNSYPTLIITENDVPSNRWLLSQLHHCFGDMLQVECKHKRYGSLLFHKNCDLLKALSSVLGKNKILQSNDSNEDSRSTGNKSPSIEEQ